MAGAAAHASGKRVGKLLRTTRQADQRQERHQGVLRSRTTLIGASCMTADTATSRSLACLEIWGGNCAVQEALELPGLSAWVYSRPLHDAERGGDVYYLSACSHALITRIALADVSGHGQGVDPLAQTLRRLMHKYVNHWDQGEFAEALNRAFRSTQDQFQEQLDALGLHGAIFATCTILGYYCEEQQLLMTNAGHMPPLHYSA